MRQMDCDHYFQTISNDYEYFKLASIRTANLTGYKVKLEFLAVGSKGALIILSEGINSVQHYLFGIIDIA